VPRRKPWDAPATLLSRHAPSPGGSLQTVQVVTLLASHILQNSPQFLVPGVEVWTSRGPILGADKCRKIPPQPLLSSLGFWAGTESWWKTHSLPLKRVILSCFTTPCSTSSWYTRTPVSPLSCKNEAVTELMVRPSSLDDKYQHFGEPCCSQLFYAKNGLMCAVIQNNITTSMN
jgi:hypothetical protein